MFHYQSCEFPTNGSAKRSRSPPVAVKESVCSFHLKCQTYWIYRIHSGPSNLHDDSRRHVLRTIERRETGTWDLDRSHFGGGGLLCSLEHKFRTTSCMQDALCCEPQVQSQMFPSAARMTLVERATSAGTGSGCSLGTSGRGPSGTKSICL